MSKNRSTQKPSSSSSLSASQLHSMTRTLGQHYLRSNPTAPISLGLLGRKGGSARNDSSQWRNYAWNALKKHGPRTARNLVSHAHKWLKLNHRGYGNYWKGKPSHTHLDQKRTSRPRTRGSSGFSPSYAPSAVSATYKNRNRQSMTSSRTEVCEISSVFGADFEPVAVNVNPGSSVLFPWGHRMSRLFDLFECKELVMRYVGSCPSATPGKVGLAYEPDYTDNVPGNFEEAMAISGATSCAAWKNCTLRVPTSLFRPNRTNAKFISNSTDSIYNTPDFTLGRFIIFTENGDSVTSTGYFEIEYVFQLIVPQIHDFIADATYLHLRATGHSFNAGITYLNGTTPTSNSTLQNAGLTWDGQSLIFPENPALYGGYTVVMQISASGTAPYTNPGAAGATLTTGGVVAVEAFYNGVGALASGRKSVAGSTTGTSSFKIQHVQFRPSGPSTGGTLAMGDLIAGTGVYDLDLIIFKTTNHLSEPMRLNLLAKTISPVPQREQKSMQPQLDLGGPDEGPIVPLPSLEPPALLRAPNSLPPSPHHEGRMSESYASLREVLSAEGLTTNWKVVPTDRKVRDL
jgi:hypothetical protein